MIVITEELGVVILMGHYKENMDVHLTYEYQEETGRMDLIVTFVGEAFGPLSQGDPLSLSLIQNAVPSLTCSYSHEEGQGIVAGTF